MPDSPEIAALVDELKALAAGQGFTAAKAQRQEKLVGLGYRKAAVAAGEDASTAGLLLALRAAVERLRSAGAKLGSPKRYFPTHLVVEAALGIGRFTSDSLMDRRNDAALTIEAAGTTLAKYEGQALREVAIILGSHCHDPRSLSAQLDPTISEMMEWSECAATKIRVDRTYFFDHAGVVVEFERSEVVRANAEELGSVAFWSEYYADSSAGIIRATRVLNAGLGRQQDSSGGHFTEIILDPPLKRGEERMFVVHLTVASTIRCMPRIRCVAPYDTLAAQISLQFEPSYRPTAVWWWTQAGGEFQAVPERTIPVSPVGYVTFLFTEISEGRNYGLVWEWPDRANSASGEEVRHG